MSEFEIINVNLDNIGKYGVGCSKNPKYPGFIAKKVWLESRFKEGLKLKILAQNNNNKPEGFIEYIPGEYTWRGIEAHGYFVIQCIYIYAKKNKNVGLGSKLVQTCIDDAKANDMMGVASLVSEGSFIASKDLFLKNGI